MCLFHQGSGVITHPLTNPDMLHQDRIRFLTVAPDLVVRSGSLSYLAGRINDLLYRLTAAMNPHDRSEGTELEPAYQKLPEFLILRHASMEASDVGRPPRNSTQSHVNTGTDLLAEVLIRRHVSPDHTSAP